MNEQFLGIFTTNLNKKEYLVYFYEHANTNKYKGFLDILPFIDWEPYDPAVMLKTGFAIDI